MATEEDIIIRAMEKEDARKLEEKLKASGCTFALYKSYIEETTSKACDYMAAYYKGEAVGFAKLDWHSAYEDFEEAHIPEIKDLWVQENLRGKGIAYELLKALEKKAATQSDVCAVGVGLAEEFEAAQNLCEKLGYEPDGKGVFYIDSEMVEDELEVDDHQALMMIKTL